MNNGMFYEHLSCIYSQVALVVKNPSANAGDIRDACSILGWEDPLEEIMASSPITLWQIGGETVATVRAFILGAPK